MSHAIGRRVARVDGYEKVTGEAVYGDDIRLPGMLYGACRYADIPAGRITRLDVSKAEGMKGVHAVVTHRDIPGARELGPLVKDYFPLVADEVFFLGDVIATVAAETREIAYAAVDAIEVEYEPYEPVTDVEKALEEGARLVRPDKGSNVAVHYPLRKGDVEKGFAVSDRIVERSYRTGYQEHAYIEPESVTVAPDANSKGYAIYGSIQNSFKVRSFVSQFLGIGLNRINVVRSVLGGSFGGKDDVIDHIACRTALLCKKAGRPVKTTYTREASFRESSKRHPYRLTYKVGFGNDGKLKAMRIRILADNGPYTWLSVFVIWRSVVQATGPYEIDNVSTDIRAVYTNNLVSSAFRGFGSPQVVFAQESLMDEIAELCGISPVEIRRLNGYRQNSVTASGQRLSQHTVSLLPVMEETLRQGEYEKKVREFKALNEPASRYRYGVGFACSFRGCSLGAEGADFSSAIVTIQPDGTAVVSTAVSENGQGLQTTMCLTLSEVLGLELGKIAFQEPATSAIADGGPTVASRSTLVGGSAVKQAAEKIKERMFALAKEQLQVERLEETIWKEGKIHRKEAREGIPPVPLSDIAKTAYFKSVNLSAYGWFKGPQVSWNEETGQGDAYFTYVYGCHQAEIRVDGHTGKVEVLKVTAAHDVGRAINRTGAEGQIYGGVAQGIGYGVLEDFNVQNAEIKSENLDAYLLPTVKDMGEIHPILVENPDRYGPYGAKSMGEPTAELTAAAINNAFCFAMGKRSYRIPLTLEQVMLGYNLKKPVRQSELLHAKGTKKQTLRLTGLNIETPATLQEALELLAKGNCKPISGGTDIVVQARLQTGRQNLLNIFSLPELNAIEEREEEIRIGGAVTFSRLIEHDLVRKHFPLMVEACGRIGSTQIRNRATIGGNVANAAPCADSLPPLILHDAKANLRSLKAERTVDIGEFVRRGYETVLDKRELLVSISLPKPKERPYIYSYCQLGRRNAVNITRMSICVRVLFDDTGAIEECRLVDGSLFSRQQRLFEVERALEGRKLEQKTIDAASVPLMKKIEEAIGGRWSGAYKIPVFLHMFRDAMSDVKKQYENTVTQNPS